MADPKPPTQAQLLDYIRQNYPHLYGLLNVNAEVRKVLLTAATKHYDLAKLQGALSATRWWRTTIATAREWDSAYAQDPATGAALLAQTRNQILDSAARLGVPLDMKGANDLALKVRRLGWTQEQVLKGLGAKFTLAAQAGTGQATVENLRALAGEYGLTYSDAALVNWTRRIISGTADPDGFRAEVVKKAQSLYSSIADEITPARSVKDYADQYAQVAAQLGVVANPDEFDLTNDRWRRALDTVDPQTGKRVPMTLEQWSSEVRTNPLYGWDRTANGRASAAAFATQLLKATGQQ